MKEGRLKRLALVLLRTIVSVGLITYVFVYMIEYADSVRLADGSERRGRVLDVNDQGVRIREEDGAEVFLPSSDLLPADEGAPVHYGFVAVVSRSNPKLLALGFAILFAVNMVALYRLWLLFLSQGIALPLRDVFRWHFIGNFYNTFLPGLTGGDLVKAFYVIQRTQGRRTAAAVTILFDRVIGIVALAMLAGTVLAFRLTDPRLREAAIVIYGFLGAFSVGSCLFYSRRVRRFLRIDRLIEILPLAGVVKRIDEAVFLFRYRKGAVLTAMGLSIFAHSVSILVNYTFGLALGLREVDLAHYFVFVPTIMILSVIPISLGGFGFGEAMYLHFFQAVAPGGTDVGNRAVALSLVMRLSQTLWSLLGGFFLLRGEPRATEEDLRRVAE